MMGNSCTSARSAKAPPQDTMEAPLSRCETKEEPTAWCPSSNRLNKEGNYSVPETDAESHAMAPSTITKFIVAPGATVSCHVGHRDLVEIFPLNVTVIFHADPTTILCNHKMKPADLKAAARSAKLFPKVFKLPSE